jgi:hypothetical protein
MMMCAQGTDEKRRLDILVCNGARYLIELAASVTFSSLQEHVTRVEKEYAAFYGLRVTFVFHSSVFPRDFSPFLCAI